MTFTRVKTLSIQYSSVFVLCSLVRASWENVNTC